MPKVTPFKAIRPTPEVAERFCALPYDVYNRKEAKEIVLKDPVTFLSIDRAESSFDDSVDTYDDAVYLKARELFENRLRDGTLIQDGVSSYYIYELTMNGRVQTGLVACSSVDDYVSSVIKKHENTREDKEIDRIRHVDTLNAHTGPIFLIYRTNNELKNIISAVKNSEDPVYDFTSDDGIRHRAFLINKEEMVKKIEDIFEDIPCTYIADGHHRCASAAKVGLKRRAENPSHNGTEGYNRFLSVLFPDDELYIMPYNRVVKDICGMTPGEFLDKVRLSGFEVKKSDSVKPYEPVRKGQFGLFLEDEWYILDAKSEIMSDDPVEGLDVSILQNNLLGPVLKIEDPRRDKRIDFVGGIRGTAELERRCQEDMKIAFSMYPTSIEELLRVADAGLLMPPKSTWFEPKLRSGMFIHSLDD